MNAKTQAKQLVLVADILGFSSIVKNLTGDELSTRIKEWTDLVDLLVKKHGLSEYQLLSDTLFVSCEYNVDKAKSMLLLSRDLLSDGLEKSIPIRGAISYGEAIWGKLIYGKAVFNAHALEMDQNWIGVTCSLEIPDIQEYYANGFVICYPPCLKSGKFRLMPVVNWTPPSGGTLFKKCVAKGLMKEGDQIDSKLVQMIDNTNTFRLYKEFVVSNGLSTSQYYGTYHTNFLG